VSDAGFEICQSSRIASFKIPRYVLLVKEYPMTSSGKVQKFKLREDSIEALGLQGRP
jgi:fatty-acyl-CoA synthase